VVELHFGGIVYDLDEDQSVADVFNLMNNYTKKQGGTTWLKLADGRSVHVQVDGQPTFAVVVPAGYRGEGLKVTRSSQPVDVEAEPFDPTTI
jgi:hypothetical protein